MSIVSKLTQPKRSVDVTNFSSRPPKFTLMFSEAVLYNQSIKEWTYTTPNGSLVELGRVIHSWLRHGLIPSGAVEVK